MHHGERFNGYSHLAGALLAVPAAARLLVDTAARRDAAATAGVLVFAVSALLLYVASTMFHSSRGRARQRWARADHCAIYALIAGTYTPFALAVLGGAAAWAALAGMWAVAALGIRREWRAGVGSGAPSVVLYVAAGWLAVIAAAPIAAALHGASLAWLLAGAACYTLGTVFYRNPFGLPHAHGTWHLFVLAGTACHYLSIAALVGTSARG